MVYIKNFNVWFPAIILMYRQNLKVTKLKICTKRIIQHRMVHELLKMGQGLSE